MRHFDVSHASLAHHATDAEASRANSSGLSIARGVASARYLALLAHDVKRRIEERGTRRADHVVAAQVLDDHRGQRCSWGGSTTRGAGDAVSVGASSGSDGA